MPQPPISQLFPALPFDRPWQLLRPPAIADPETSIGFDEKLLRQVSRGEIAPCICIKQEPQCLVVTKREARMENFAGARTILAADGWPVVIRSTGGSCVPQGAGVLNLSLIHPRVKGWTLDDGYRLLCALCGQLLKSYGLEAETGEVPGSFCDGRYNLQVAGRKLVGTAQRWAGSERKQASILSHACLLVDPDLAEATARINQLYRLCNNAQQFAPEACTTLRECLAADPAGRDKRDTLMAEVEQRLGLLTAASFGIVQSG